ncbi:L-ascorbate metabolism protein UlaG (beta-lactamase superfamily) [Methanolinea mesophila]|uniref:metal-dependent hydrolase n=1 Tax=Methanolinea mesophila TaxID=547055 RepID=UPI001AE5E119|nr:metal-dependent hydrolase [Methanolinea mesophila]MBP1928174.1 L-ascorbate metabolism protein UlaG (beta-lactamase superfamily) [Methanolinea mesophila]
MDLTWLGHSCVLLRGSKTILIDPFIPEGKVPESPDLVALTHGHADHMGMTTELAKPTIAINEVAKYLKGKGLPAEAMNLGGSITVSGVKFTMTPAVHSNWLEEAGPGYSGGAAAGLVIRMDGTTVYHAGDTALFSDMQLIGELYHPDVALLPIGGRYTMGPEEAMIAARFVGAPLVIPVHYGTWPIIDQDPEAFRRAVERTTDIKVKVLKPGETVTL